MIFDILRLYRPLVTLSLAAALAALGQVGQGLARLGHGHPVVLQASTFVFSVAPALGAAVAFAGAVVLMIQPRESRRTQAVRDLRSLFAIGAGLSLWALGSLLVAFGLLGNQSEGLRDSGLAFQCLGYTLLIVVLVGMAIHADMDAYQKRNGSQSRASTVLMVGAFGFVCGVVSRVLEVSVGPGTTVGDLDVSVTVLTAISYGSIASALLLAAGFRLVTSRRAALLGIGSSMSALGALINAVGIGGATKTLSITGYILVGLGFAVLGLTSWASALAADRRSPVQDGVRHRDWLVKHV